MTVNVTVARYGCPAGDLRRHAVRAANWIGLRHGVRVMAVPQPLRWYLGRRAREFDLVLREDAGAVGHRHVPAAELHHLSAKRHVGGVQVSA